MRLLPQRTPTDITGIGSFSRLLGQAKGGDEAATSVLYMEHVAMVYSYLRACGAADPDDVTSEVFVGMLRGLDHFDGDHADFRRWLMTIAHRRLIDERRRRGSSRIDLSEPATLEAVRGDGMTTELQALEIDAELIQAFQNLTDAQQEVLALRFVADLSLDAVATITGRPTGAIKSLQNRGLESIRRRLPSTLARQDA